MAKYNIYKILPEKTNELLKKLASVKLHGQRPKNINGYTIQLFFPEKPHEKDVPWYEQYKDFIDKEREIKNLSYFAVLMIFKNKEAIYAVSLGKSFFYLQEFCDLDFGINIGLRILNEKSVNSKNARQFGSSKKKSLIIYKPNTHIDIESGEAVAYLKGQTIDSQKWGRTLTCGSSAYFSIKDFTPIMLPGLIISIEEVLKQEPLFNIPRAKIITNQIEIKKLDQKFISYLKRNNENVEIEEQSLVGIDFIFQKDFALSVKFQNCNKWISLEEQTIHALIEIFDNNDFVLSPENIENVKIKANPDEGAGFTRNLRYFIDYVDEENFFLSNGKWFQLNDDYVSYLLSELERIEIEQAPIQFSSTRFQNYKNSIKDKEEQNKWYMERYFNEIECGKHEFINLDRKLEYFESFKLEVADLYKNDTIYHVKIGKISKQNYVLQQCMASLKYLKDNKYKFLIDAKEVTPTTICLWLIFEKEKHIKALKELRSFIFLSELLDCYKAVKDAGLKLKVIIDYKRE